MPNIGPAEIFVILIVGLLVFGPDKLPEIGKQVGRAVREFRKVQATLREEVREVLEPREVTGSGASPPQLPPIVEPSLHSEPDSAGDHAAGDEGAPGMAPDAATTNAPVPGPPSSGPPSGEGAKRASPRPDPEPADDGSRPDNASPASETSRAEGENGPAGTPESGGSH